MGKKTNFLIVLTILLLELSLFVLPVLAISQDVKITIPKRFSDFDVEGRILEYWRVADDVEVAGNSGLDAFSDKVIWWINRLNPMSKSELDKHYGLSVKTERSDHDGRIIIRGLSEGLYYVREVKDDRFDGEVVPFLIMIPMAETEIIPKVIGGENPPPPPPYVPPEEPPEVPPYVPPEKPPKVPPYIPPEKPPEQPPYIPPLAPPELPVGGHSFIKVSDKGDPLQGAKFWLSIKRDGKLVNVKVNKKDLVLISDEEGKFRIDNLPYGEYYLWEIAAPSGYMKLSQAVSFKVDADSNSKSTVIKNKPVGKKIKIPKTGDMTLFMMVISGFVLIGSGCLLIKK